MFTSQQGEIFSNKKIILEKIDSCISTLYSLNYSIILGGDFNVIFDEKMDYMGATRVVRSTFLKDLEMFLRKLELYDVWRKNNPDLKQYTFRQKTPLVQSRLDYWFISNQLEQAVSTCEILPSITPDHAGIILGVKFVKTNHMHGRSYWKYNNSLCLDKKFLEGMVNEINFIKRDWGNIFDKKLLFWDYLKMKMRAYAIKFSKAKAKEKTENIQRLENEVKKLVSEIVRFLLEVW